MPKDVEHFYISFGMVNDENLYDISHPNFETQFKSIMREIGVKNEGFYTQVYNQYLTKNFENKILQDKVEMLKNIATLYQQSVG